MQAFSEIDFPMVRGDETSQVALFFPGAHKFRRDAVNYIKILICIEWLA